MDIVRILVDIEASKRTSTTKKTKLPFVSRQHVNMAPLRGVCQTIVFRMHIESLGCSYDEEKTWICIVS